MFETAGLGKAPFRFLRTERKVGPIKFVTKEGFTVEIGAPGQAMSSCDYCGQGIAIECWIRSADGREFKVGCDCVARTGDEGLRRRVSAAKREHDRELRQARKARKEAELAASSETRCTEILARLDRLMNEGDDYTASVAGDMARSLRQGRRAELSQAQIDFVAKLEAKLG